MGILLKMVVNGVFAILSGGFVHYLYFQSGEIIDSTSFFAWCLESLIQIWVHFHVKKKTMLFWLASFVSVGNQLVNSLPPPSTSICCTASIVQGSGKFPPPDEKNSGILVYFFQRKKKRRPQKGLPPQHFGETTWRMNTKKNAIDWHHRINCFFLYFTEV